MEWFLSTPGGIGGGPGGFPGGGGPGAFPGGGGGGRGRGGGGFPGGGGGGRGGVELAACSQDAAKICPGLPGGGVTRACLEANSTAVSKACKAEIDANPMESRYPIVLPFAHLRQSDYRHRERSQRARSVEANLGICSQLPL